MLLCWPVIKSIFGPLSVFLKLCAIKIQLHTINLKDSLSHSQIYLLDWERAQEGTHLLKKFSEIKSGASKTVGCFFIFMQSQALARECCACHWPCTDKALHKKCDATC